MGSSGPPLALSALTLLVCGAVAAVPPLLQDRKPGVIPLRAAAGTPLWVVLDAQGRWHLNGEPLPAAALARLLAREGGRRPVHLLPAARLPIGEVRQSLGWLRRQAGAVVMLPLPQVRR
jgi:hypothetical protein